MESGYREIEHTADWELEVWAPNFTSLLEQAALGMFKLSGMTLKGEPKETRSFYFSASDLESLLVDFLSELIFLAEQEYLGFDQFDIAPEGESLAVQLSGSPIKILHREIKAVTYHNLKISESKEGLNTRIVFDV